jgi:hypothetical protein
LPQRPERQLVEAAAGRALGDADGHMVERGLILPPETPANKLRWLL